MRERGTQSALANKTLTRPGLLSSAEAVPGYRDRDAERQDERHAARAHTQSRSGRARVAPHLRQLTSWGHHVRAVLADRSVGRTFSVHPFVPCSRSQTPPVLKASPHAVESKTSTHASLPACFRAFFHTLSLSCARACTTVTPLRARGSCRDRPRGKAGEVAGLCALAYRLLSSRPCWVAYLEAAWSWRTWFDSRLQVIRPRCAPATVHPNTRAGPPTPCEPVPSAGVLGAWYTPSGSTMKGDARQLQDEANARPARPASTMDRPPPPRSKPGNVIAGNLGLLPIPKKASSNPLPGQNGAALHAMQHLSGFQALPSQSTGLIVPGAKLKERQAAAHSGQATSGGGESRRASDGAARGHPLPSDSAGRQGTPGSKPIVFGTHDEPDDEGAEETSAARAGGGAPSGHNDTVNRRLKSLNTPRPARHSVEAQRGHAFGTHHAVSTLVFERAQGHTETFKFLVEEEVQEVKVDEEEDEEEQEEEGEATERPTKTVETVFSLDDIEGVLLSPHWLVFCLKATHARVMAASGKPQVSEATNRFVGIAVAKKAADVARLVSASIVAWLETKQMADALFMSDFPSTVCDKELLALKKRAKPQRDSEKKMKELFQNYSMRLGNRERVPAAHASGTGGSAGQRDTTGRATLAAVLLADKAKSVQTAARGLKAVDTDAGWQSAKPAPPGRGASPAGGKTGRPGPGKGGAVTGQHAPAGRKPPVPAPFAQFWAGKGVKPSHDPIVVANSAPNSVAERKRRALALTRPQFRYPTTVLDATFEAERDEDARKALAEAAKTATAVDDDDEVQCLTAEEASAEKKRFDATRIAAEGAAERARLEALLGTGMKVEEIQGRAQEKKRSLTRHTINVSMEDISRMDDGE